MKIAIQTNVWGPEIHQHHLPQVLAEAALAGYDGIEIGAHRIDINQPATFAKLLAANRLVAAGLHVHSEPYNPEVMRQVYDRLVRVADFAAVVGAQHVLMSGRRKEDKAIEDFEREAEALNHAGQICQAAGVPFLYHNHNWEIEHDLRELRYLRDHTDARLVSFALDVGWVHRAGQSPVAITREFLPRARYFHVKDHIGDRWADVGAGEVNYPEWLEVVRDRDDVWLTVERDEALPNAAESAMLSHRYLKKIGA